MKSIIKTAAFLFLLATTWSCNEQHMMRTLNDAQKLQTNKQLFIGKPLKKLLKEIKPEIKMVLVRESWAEAIGVIIFKFVDREGYKKYNKEGKVPLGVNVMIKEKLEWDKSDKPLADREKWTKEDAKKYGDLTIVDIRVYGENF